MFIFFFQAEDGIRDTSVTGVQTCALPICLPAAAAALLRRRPVDVADAAGVPVGAGETVEELPPRPAGGGNAEHPEVARSEERRVGKECSSRWSPSRQKKEKGDAS